MEQDLKIGIVIALLSGNNELKNLLTTVQKALSRTSRCELYPGSGYGFSDWNVLQLSDNILREWASW